jgi:hypothetical protein
VPATRAAYVNNLYKFNRGYKMKKILSFLLIVSLIGCGTTKSLEGTNLVTYVIITVSNDLKITGRLLEDTETFLLVSIDGTSQKYIKSEIKGYKFAQLPDERLMLEDIVNNSSNAANNTALFVAVLVAAFISSLIVSNTK